MAQEIHLTNIPLDLVEEHDSGAIKEYKATIDEIYMDSLGNPYQVVINYNGKSRRVTPKFDDGVITFRYRRFRYEGFVSQ